MSASLPRLTVRHETLAVLALALGFGLVGIDRFLISTLYPTIAAELNLAYSDIGIITGALAVAWGAAALFMGNLSDHIGRRLVLTCSLIAFALLIGASGLAHGLMGLVMVRLAMGFADGAYTPPSISATMEVSAPQRRGRNIGFQQLTLTLFGLGLAPLLVTALLHVVNWRWIFVIFAVPGLAVAWFVWKVIPPSAPPAPEVKRSRVADIKAVLHYRNIRLGMVLMLCWLTCLITTSAFMPQLLTDYLKLSPEDMGRVMSAIGMGSAVGTVALPWLSDRFGRKPVMILSTLGTLASLVALNALPPDVPLLFASLFCVHFFNNALITLTVGPLCSETVPATLMATSSGVVIAIGEFFGGGVAPVVGGIVADTFGIEHILWLPIAALVLGFILSTMTRETLSK